MHDTKKVNGQILFTVIGGSKLYGTHTDQSDTDLKTVYIPVLDDLLLNNELHITKKSTRKNGEKCGFGDVEEEFIPLHVFLDHFEQGQTYALELAFAVKAGMFSPVGWADVQVQNMCIELISKFLTKNVKKMVGYAVSQSKLYGLKTERYGALNSANTIIGQHFPLDSQMKNVRLSETPGLVDHLCRLQYITKCEVMNAKGGTESAPALDICGKKHPYTSYWITVVNSLRATLMMYGTRVKEFEHAKTDWKALSHAIRITEQVLELCQNHTLTFPRPNAQFLLNVKTGKLSLDEATEYLQNTFAKIDDAILESNLPERTSVMETDFKAWKLNMLRKMYGVEIGDIA